jgi:DASH complex subunit DAM1
MGPALENLADETEALHANLEGLNALATSLETFNESFASYLYVQKVNVFCVEWFQVSAQCRVSRVAVAYEVAQGAGGSVI